MGEGDRTTGAAASATASDLEQGHARLGGFRCYLIVSFINGLFLYYFQCEPTLLPEPNHVMLNHLYALSIKDGVMVLSATHRYRKKYVTTLLYKPIDTFKG